MMDRALAERLLQIVGDPMLRGTLEAYAAYRLAEAGRGLEQASDLLSLGRGQGAVYELRRLLSLREEIQAHERK